MFHTGWMLWSFHRCWKLQRTICDNTNCASQTLSLHLHSVKARKHYWTSDLTTSYLLGKIWNWANLCTSKSYSYFEMTIFLDLPKNCVYYFSNTVKPYPLSLRLTIKCYNFKKVILIEACECFVYICANFKNFISVTQTRSPII